MMIRDSSSDQSDVMVGTPPLTQHYEHVSASAIATTTPSSTPNDGMPPLAPSRKDILGRVMIELDESS